jgi:hypothetical protein
MSPPVAACIRSADGVALVFGTRLRGITAVCGWGGTRLCTRLSRVSRTRLSSALVSRLWALVSGGVALVSGQVSLVRRLNALDFPYRSVAAFMRAAKGTLLHAPKRG